jgi:hypothetical protein
VASTRRYWPAWASPRPGAPRSAVAHISALSQIDPSSTHGREIGAGSGDLLHITKALLARSCGAISASSLVRRPASGGSCPSECPSGANAHRFSVRILTLTLVEPSGLEPLTSCMPYPAKLSRTVAGLARYLWRVRRTPPRANVVGVGCGCQLPRHSIPKDHSLVSLVRVVVYRRWPGITPRRCPLRSGHMACGCGQFWRSLPSAAVLAPRTCDVRPWVTWLGCVVLAPAEGDSAHGIVWWISLREPPGSRVCPECNHPYRRKGACAPAGPAVHTGPSGTTSAASRMAAVPAVSVKFRGPRTSVLGFLVIGSVFVAFWKWDSLSWHTRGMILAAYGVVCLGAGLIPAFGICQPR